jgi:hypothetical protein
MSVINFGTSGWRGTISKHPKRVVVDLMFGAGRGYLDASLKPSAAALDLVQ